MPMSTIRAILGFAAVAVALLAVTAASVAKQSSNRSAEETTCFGLGCKDPGQSDFVPQADGNVPSLDDGADLSKQEAGFYESSGNPDVDAVGDETFVSYVSPGGEDDSMPASVKNLEIVEATRGMWDGGNVVVVDPRVLTIDFGANQRIQRDLNSCPDNSFCGFNQEGSGGPDRMVLYGPTWKGFGWINLNGFEGGKYNDNLESMENDRNGISKLARNTDGSGIDYCAQRYSWDSSFGNNPIDNNRASAAKVMEASAC